MSAESMVEYEVACEAARLSIKKLAILDEDNELFRFCRFVVSRHEALYSCKEDGWFADREKFYARFLTDKDREIWSEGDFGRLIRATENYARALEEKIDQFECSM